MKLFLKSITIILAMATGAALGIGLLTKPAWWKVLVFLLACRSLGQCVYVILRKIDKMA